MFERFTDRSRKVMALANQEAQRFNHEYIGTEHLLLGLVKEGSGVGANTLKTLDVDLRKVRLEVEKLVKTGQGHPSQVPYGKLPQTPRAKKVIEYAIEEARNLNHNYVGTEHLLLGLIREQEGIAAQVLRNFGLKLDEVREEIVNILGQGVKPNEHPAAPSVPIVSPPLQSEGVALAGIQSSMFERFDDHARKVMALANQEAQRLNHEYIGTEHILLALVKEGSGMGAKILKSLNVDLRRVRLEVERLVRSGPDLISMGKLPQTPRAKQVLALAATEATMLNRACVGSEHLLLGLIREHDGVAAQVLRNLGLKLEQVRDEVLNILAGRDGKEQVATSANVNEVMDSTVEAIPTKYRVGIVGVSGYGGGEALRLCARHPNLDVVYAAGESTAGKKVGDRFPGIDRYGELVIQKWGADTLPELDLLFVSLPTGESLVALANVHPKVRIIDIGGDHRYAAGWTYGLADIWPDKIRGATRIANPGCYPAATLAAIAPLLDAGLVDLEKPIIIDAKSGVSGAGRGGGDSKFSFAEINEDLSAYGLLKHAHLPEIKQTLATLAEGITEQVTFTPHLIPMTRGILATCYLWGEATSEQCMAAARSFYRERPFVRMVDQPPHTKWATGSNLVFLHYTTAGNGGPIIALAAIDNLGKGAAGQAVQNANLMLGLPETTGLLGVPLWP